MALPQYGRITQALQVLADEANLIPNVPAVQGLQQINNRLHQMQQTDKSLTKHNKSWKCNKHIFCI
jgi:hypothetical protein